MLFYKKYSFTEDSIELYYKKIMKKVSSFPRIAFLLITLITSTFLSSCKKDATSDLRKVEYKVISAFSNITSVSYTDINGNEKLISNVPSGSTYSSGTLSIPNSVTSLTITAMAPGTNSTNITVQIYVENILKKEFTKTGANNQGIMIATTSF